MYTSNEAESITLASRIGSKDITCDVISETIDANKRRIIVDKYNNGDVDLLLLTSGMNDYISREIKYLYLNNNSIDTITTLVHFYYGCHLRKFLFFL